VSSFERAKQEQIVSLKVLRLRSGLRERFAGHLFRQNLAQSRLRSRVKVEVAVLGFRP